MLVGLLITLSLKYNPKGLLPEVPYRPERPIVAEQDSGKTEIAAIPLQVCIPIGCQSISPVNADSLQRLKAGNNMVVDFIDIRTGPVSLNVSLSGMTAAVNWLDQQSPS